MGRPNMYKAILNILGELYETHPTIGLGRHLEALSVECNNLWGTSNEELYKALKAYKSRMELDLTMPEKTIDEIINEGEHLETLFSNEEED